VLDDEPAGFWDRVEKHVRATWPMYKLLRHHDTTAPSVGKVYHGFYSVGQHIAEKCQDISYSKQLKEAHHERWCYGGDGPFFCAAYMVDPEFIGHGQCTNKEVVEGFNTVVERIAILLEVRRIEEETGAFSEL